MNKALLEKAGHSVDEITNFESLKAVADDIHARAVGVNDKGELQLSGICLVAGLGGATRRDGSLEYYFSEPVVENDAKGVAPLLLAYTEMIIQ